MRLNSLALRLFFSATTWTVVILVVTGIVLSSIYRAAVERAFDRRLGVYLRTLVADVATPEPAGPRLSISLMNRQVTNPVIMSYQGQAAAVRVNRELQGIDGKPAERSTRHVEIALPAGLTYRTGDHLGVLGERHERRRDRRHLQP